MKAPLHFHAWLLRAACLVSATTVNVAVAAEDASAPLAASPANGPGSAGGSDREFFVR